MIASGVRVAGWLRQYASARHILSILQFGKVRTVLHRMHM